MRKRIILKGKILIVKTFGLSQIIYSLQVCTITDRDLKIIEQLIFKFIWSKKWGIVKALDRIKREIMMKEYCHGGLKAPNIYQIDSAIKAKQFTRSVNDGNKHPIQRLQSLLLKEMGYDHATRQEYNKFCKNSFIRKAQETINEITDVMRSSV